MADCLDICGMVDLQELPYRIIEVDMQDFPTMTIVEIDFWDLECMPNACVRLAEGQVLEEFMLKEDMDFQGRDQNVELPSKQEICVEMKTCDMSLPELSKMKESVHTNEVELEMPKINEVEIKKLPRKVKLDMPTEQDKSNLHTKQKNVLGSKVIRRANPTKLVKREVCRPPPKPPYILNINGEVIGLIENVASKTRPP